MKKHKTPSVLVCVTGQKDCERLIRVGKDVSTHMKLELQVLCVQPIMNGFYASSQEIEYLHKVSKEVGAEMTIIFHDDSAIIAASFIQKINAKQLVTGMPDGRKNGFIDIIRMLIPNIPISMVSKDEKIYNMLPVYQNLSVGSF